MHALRVRCCEGRWRSPFGIDITNSLGDRTDARVQSKKHLDSTREAIMTKSLVLRAILAIIIFVMGNLQAWDSEVPAAGLLIVFLVSLAIALPPVALLIHLKTPAFLGALAVALGLLIIARLASPIPLPGLFLVLVPAGTGLIFTGIFRSDIEEASKAGPRTLDNP